MGGPIPRTAGAAEEVDKLAAALTEGQESAAALVDRVLGDAVHSPVSCSATCHPSDQYDRKAGIAIAFKRALLKVKEVTEGGRAS